jgi:tight adherence protein B
MMLASVALILMLIGAAIFATELVRRRRERLAVANRVNVIEMARLQRQTEAPDAFGGLLRVGTKKFEILTRQIFALGIKRTWGMRSGALTLLLAASASAGVVWNLANSFFVISPLPSILASILTFFLVPRFILSREQRRADQNFTDAFPDALDTVARMIRAGLPITAAMQTVAVESPPPVSKVFEAISDQTIIGIPLRDALEESSARIALPDFRFFAVSVSLQYASGGNLTQTLDILSDIVRKRRAMRLKAAASTGEIRMTAYTLGAVPVFTTLALLVSNPTYLVPLWADPRGHYILGLAGVLLFLAYFSMRTMMRSVSSV